MSQNQSRVRESLREMVVVVISILIAFGLDAAWDQRNERNEERRMLRSVAEDMRWNVEELDRASDLHLDVLEASKELFASMGPRPLQISPSRFDSLVMRTVNYWTYDPRVGSIQALLSSMNLVSSPELRSAIAQWPETLRDFREDEERGAAEVDDQLLPAVQMLVPVGVYPMESDLGELAQWPDDSHAWLTPTAIRAVLSDLFIANEVAARIGRQSVILSEAADLRALMTRIVDLIDAELGR